LSIPWKSSKVVIVRPDTPEAGQPCTRSR